MKKISHTFYFVMGCLLTIVVAFTVGSIFASTNMVDTQQETEPPIIVIPTLDSTSLQKPAQQEVDLSDYNIVYLSDNSNSDERLAPENLFGNSVNIQLVESVTDVEAIANIQPIDALVINGFTDIDPIWTAELVRQGTNIVAIDITLPQYAEWLNSDCLRNMASNPSQVALETKSSHYAYSQAVYVESEYNEDIAAVVDYALNKSCLPDTQEGPEVFGQYFLSGDFSISSLDTEQDLANFQQLFNQFLKTKDELAYNFANRHSPTPVPGLSNSNFGG